MFAESITVIASGPELDLTSVAAGVQKRLGYSTSNVRSTRDGARFDVLIDRHTALEANQDETVRNRVVMAVLETASALADKYHLKVVHLGVQGWNF